MKNLILQSVQEYIDKYNSMENITFPLPKITIIPSRFDLKGKVAGQFGYSPSQCYFRWNLTIARENQTDYLKQTVGHEVAHWIVHNIDKHAQAHGITWKRVMLSLGLEPLRCHNYTCKPARTIDRPFNRHCSCGSYPITAVKFKNFVLSGLTASGQTIYRCKCGRMISIHDVKPA